MKHPAGGILLASYLPSWDSLVLLLLWRVVGTIIRGGSLMLVLAIFDMGSVPLLSVLPVLMDRIPGPSSGKENASRDESIMHL